MTKFCYLKRLELKNIRGFASLDVQFDSTVRRPTAVIGRNGTCKTTLLRCMALALTGSTGDQVGQLDFPGGRWLKAGESEGAIRLHFGPAESSDAESAELALEERDGGEVISKLSSHRSLGKIFICAYGTGRSDFGTEPGRDYRVWDSVATLFDYGERLVPSELVLRRLQDYLGTERYGAALAGLKRALDLDPRYSIELPRGGGVEISGPDLGGRIPLEAWADGYRMTFSWLIDFYGWAMRANAFDNDGDVCGILLVDEIEQHLHPELQRKILGHLQKALPKVQIIATTHSPLVALSVDSEQIIALHREGDSVRSAPVPPLDGYSADDILVEEALFGTSPYPPATEAQLECYHELARIPPEERTAEQEGELRDLAHQLDPGSLPALRDDLVLAKLDEIASRLDREESEA